MRAWNIKKIEKIVKGKIKGSPDVCINRIILDSRKAKEGDLFVPLVGENFDGHKFLKNAFENGATAAFSKHEFYSAGLGPTILVDDPLIALQNLGTAVLKEVSPKVVAITGSTGKTSTKEMVYSILNEQFSTFKTKGNYNSEQGLPLSLYNMKDSDEIAVLEMGMRGRGQITELVNIAKPDIAVITNIGTVHLELLGTQENLALAKGEILEGLDCSGLAVLNGDDKWCKWLGKSFTGKKIYYGLSEECDIRAINLQIDNLGRYSYNIRSENNLIKVVLPIAGKHHVYNSLAGIAVARSCGMNWSSIVTGIKSYKTISGRQQSRNCRGITVIDDTYNSNPDSIRAGLELLKLHPCENKRIAVLGDMRELGDKAIQLHLDVGKELDSYNVDILVCNGNLGAYIGQGTQKNKHDIKVIYAESNSHVVKLLRNIASKGDVVLIKGSRGMEMEQIVKEYCKG